MSRLSSARQRSATLNPFVALCDILLITLTLALIYFTQQRNTLQSQIQRLIEEKNLRARIIAEHQQAVEKALKSYQELHMNTDRPEIKLYTVGEEQRFIFNESVLFPRGKSDLQPQGKALLQRFGSRLASVLRRENRVPRKYPEIQIQGHTDSLPADNWRLSGERALAVLKALTAPNAYSQDRLSEERLSLAGYSHFRPQPDVPLRYGASQPLNRRVEIRLIYGIAPQATKRTEI